MLQSEALAYDDTQHLTIVLETPVNSDMAGFQFNFRNIPFTHSLQDIALPPGEGQMYRFDICPPPDAFVPETGLFALRDAKQFAGGSRFVHERCAGGSGYRSHD